MGLYLGQPDPFSRSHRGQLYNLRRRWARITKFGVYIPVIEKPYGRRVFRSLTYFYYKCSTCFHVQLHRFVTHKDKSELDWNRQKQIEWINEDTNLHIECMLMQTCETSAFKEKLVNTRFHNIYCSYWKEEWYIYWYSTELRILLSGLQLHLY